MRGGLDQTAQALAVMGARATGAEIAQIREAEKHFLDRAREASVTAQGMRPRSVRPSLANAPEKADRVAGQAQLAIACLRRYGAALNRGAEEEPSA